MPKLIYTVLMSLDGFIEDENGRFEWAAPDETVHQFINDLERPASTHVYGRRMYATMAVWETDPQMWADSPITRDFAQIWQAADKIVYSRTLTQVQTARTRIERNFNPAQIEHLKRTASSDILIGGPTLAALAFQAQLIDECHVFIAPVVIGRGKPAFPTQGPPLPLILCEQRQFNRQMSYHYYQMRYEA